MKHALVVNELSKDDYKPNTIKHVYVINRESAFDGEAEDVFIINNMPTLEWPEKFELIYVVNNIYSREHSWQKYLHRRHFPNFVNIRNIEVLENFETLAPVFFPILRYYRCPECKVERLIEDSFQQDSIFCPVCRKMIKKLSD